MSSSKENASTVRSQIPNSMVPDSKPSPTKLKSLLQRPFLRIPSLGCLIVLLRLEKM
ncbi:hypothetical protein IC582_010099 [Cucumis melo]